MNKKESVPIKDTQKLERVQKLIAARGYCSRRKAEEIIFEGRVRCNGKIVNIGDCAKESDEITIDSKPLENKEKVIVLLNKPKGYVTSLKDPFEKTISELIPHEERLFPVGRLDKDAEGLLILTNNGDLANKVMHPSYEIEKVYVAETYDEIPRAAIDLINKFGIVIKDGYVDVRIRRIQSRVYEVKIHVGYHKVVKKIFDKFDIRVRSLRRIQVGPIGLNKMKLTEWRYLSDSEAKKFEEYVNSLKKKFVDFKMNKEKARIFEREYDVLRRDLAGIFNKIKERRANYDYKKGIRKPFEDRQERFQDDNQE
jgi:pseudouridine synthase